MKLFFELIQVSIGSKEELPSVPSAAEWEKLFVLAEKHAVIGDHWKKCVDIVVQ